MPGGGAFLPTTQTMVTMGVFRFQGKTHMVEAGIEPGTSWLVVRSSDHQATRLVTSECNTTLKLSHHNPISSMYSRVSSCDGSFDDDSLL